MDQQELHQRLERLHAELSQIDTTDPAEREHIRQLAADIRALLEEREGDRKPEYSALGDRLRDAVTSLETRYPNAALVTGQVIDALALLGL